MCSHRRNTFHLLVPWSTTIIPKAVWQTLSKCLVTVKMLSHCSMAQTDAHWQVWEPDIAIKSSFPGKNSREWGSKRKENGETGKEGTVFSSTDLVLANCCHYTLMLSHEQHFPSMSWTFCYSGCQKTNKQTNSISGHVSECSVFSVHPNISSQCWCIQCFLHLD